MKYQVREKIFRLGEDNDILNEAGQPALQVDGKVLSLHGLMLVNDLAGTEVGRVSRKLVSLMATYDITLTGGVSAELHQRRKLCGTRFHHHRERSDRRDGVQGVDQPRRLVWRRHR
jgi:uncharacterized protein YxjI